ILGLGDVHGSSQADASPDASPADGMPDAMPAAPTCGVAPPGSVVGCAHIRHFLADGSTAMDDLDFSVLTVQAYVYDSTAKTFQVVTGAGKKDGTFQIDNVPPGASFYVSIADPNALFPGYYFTDQRSIDLGFSEDGRPATPLASDTEVTVDVSGMTGWHALD